MLVNKDGFTVKNPKYYRPISLQVSKQEFQLLEELARLNNCRRSDILRKALNYYVNNIIIKE